MSPIKDIPKHWEIKKLGEVCHTTSGGTPSRGNNKYYNGSIPWVKSGELDKGLITDTEEKITQEAIDNSSAKIFPKGTLLIALYGATIGKLAFLGVDAATNQAVCGIYKNENIDSNYLFNFLFYKKPSLVKQGIGGAQPNISQGILKNLELPIPPLPEQQAIVSKIEELLSDLENGKQQLQTAQQQLKVYRQSLLKWAFEGKLTNKNVKDGELPKGWKWVKVNELRTKELNSICAGPFGTIFKAKDFRPSGIPIIFLRHVKAGSYNTRKPGYMDEGIWKDLFKSYSVYGGELLITKLGEPPGECAIYPNGIGPAMVTPDVIKMNVDESSAVPKFLMYYFNSENSRKALKDIAFGSTRLRITIPIFKNLPVPFCDKKEQEQIVQELESKLTVCDKIEETISHSLQQAETLRQSILKKAFEGKLVAQNPNDEPASKLLERIKAESVKNDVEKKKSRRDAIIIGGGEE
jgi:type I restriction enzyme S subunit